jgi:hypothetical protein
VKAAWSRWFGIWSEWARVDSILAHTVRDRVSRPLRESSYRWFNSFFWFVSPINQTTQMSPRSFYTRSAKRQWKPFGIDEVAYSSLWVTGLHFSQPLNGISASSKLSPWKPVNIPFPIGWTRVSAFSIAPPPSRLYYSALSPYFDPPRWTQETRMLPVVRPSITSARLCALSPWPARTEHLDVSTRSAVMDANKPIENWNSPRVNEKVALAVSL